MGTLKSKMVTSLNSETLTIQHLVTRYIKVEKDSMLPFIILPLLLLTATISPAMTIIVLVIIAMGALYVISRPQQKRNKSTFFYSWTVSSGLYMYIYLERGVLDILAITRLEKIVLVLLMNCTCYFFHKMKILADFEPATGSSKGKEYKLSPVLTADSLYCQICQIEVNDRFFHSIWYVLLLIRIILTLSNCLHPNFHMWDCCIAKQNYGYFLGGQVFAFATLLFGTNLGLTYVCHPYLFYESILLPHDCGEVYLQFNLTMSFVVCMYASGYLLVISLVLIHQIFVYIPKYLNIEPQWRKLMNTFSV